MLGAAAPDSMPPPDDAVFAVKAWNMMGGCIDWSALDFVCDMIGIDCIDDVEILVAQLIAMRSFK